MELKTPKGTRDYPPEEKILRDQLTNSLKKVFELYGFSPFETPLVEHFEILSSKYTGGAEILKETFKLQDQGKRDLGLRYDLTVPLARFVAMNPRMKMPFKRYHIGEVFRDGPVTLARYRQFTQCDVDVVGACSLKTDAELLALCQRALKELKLEGIIRMNNRKLLNELMHACGVEENAEDIILIIDKLDKGGKEGVRKEMHEKGIPDVTIKKILETIWAKGSNKEKVDHVRKIVGNSAGLKEVEEVLQHADAVGVEVVFDPSLARGLAYYTGTIMEAVLEGSKVKSSVMGGGRYDNMIGAMVGKASIPAIGISFGLDRLYDALTENKERQKTVTQLLLIPINTFHHASRMAEQLREAGINVEVDLMERGPSKNLQYADSLQIPFVAFVGEEEQKQDKMKLKNMKTGKESLCTIKEAIVEISHSLHK
jgi:histidyl-tRNA synthetase